MRFVVSADGVSVVVDGERRDPGGVELDAYDLGTLSARRVERDAPDRHGMIIGTRFHGGRSVSITARSPRPGALREFRRLASPGRAVEIVMDGHLQYPPVAMSAVGDSVFSAPDFGLHSSGESVVVGQWRVPDGVFRAAEWQEAMVRPSGVGAEVPGRAYNLAHNRAYPFSAPEGATLIVNGGDADVYPVLEVYGPAVDPTLTNVTTGQSIVFAGLTIPAGRYVEVDTRAHSALLDGVASSSVAHLIDQSATSWWPLVVGEQRVEFIPDSSSGPSVLIVRWRDAFI